MPKVKTKGISDTHLTPSSEDCDWCIQMNDDEFLVNKYGNYKLKKVWSVYVLLCEEGKYYIGISHSLCNRIRQHFTGKGARWTKKHKPIAILKIKQLSDKNEKTKVKQVEDLFTLWFMNQKGISNVRGGQWTSRYPLSKEVRKEVETKISKELS